ncbi:hypothetical protein WDZ17_05410 [Pseudokineococcus basanitobsidens]|uniref:KOW domain-containing protein n=1 Tax=Pseudokineococcus basanitobsidens TaxID=1926649 RepID=A0ABU8RI46_9ACTN
MADVFAVGDTVQMTGKVMTGNVGTVISIDEVRDRYLVLVTPQTQNYFAADELRRFTK